MYTEVVDIHRGGRYTQRWWMYTEVVDVWCGLFSTHINILDTLHTYTAECRYV